MSGREPAFPIDMPFRTATDAQAKRAALEELRTADRLLLPVPTPSIVDALLALLTIPAWPLALGDRGPRSSVEDDVAQARVCVRRALDLVQLGGVGDAERRVIVQLDEAYGPQLRPLVRAMFERIRASDASLHDVEPLGDG